LGKCLNRRSLGSPALLEVSGLRISFGRRVAKKLLGIGCSSANVERMFSVASRLSRKSSALSAEMEEPQIIEHLLPDPKHVRGGPSTMPDPSPVYSFFLLFSFHFSIIIFLFPYYSISFCVLTVCLACAFLVPISNIDTSFKESAGDEW